MTAEKSNTDKIAYIYYVLIAAMAGFSILYIYANHQYTETSSGAGVIINAEYDESENHYNVNVLQDDTEVVMQYHDQSFPYTAGDSVNYEVQVKSQNLITSPHGDVITITNIQKAE